MQNFAKIDLKKVKLSDLAQDNISQEELTHPNIKEKANISLVAYQDKQQDKKSELANKINKDLDKMPLHNLGTDKDPVIKEISKILGVESKAPAKDIKAQMDDLHSQVQNLDVSDPRFLDSLKGFQDQQTNRAKEPALALSPSNIEQAKAVFEVAKSLSDPKGDFRQSVERSPLSVADKDKIIKSALKDTYKKVFDLIEGDKAVPFAPPAKMGY